MKYNYNKINSQYLLKIFLALMFLLSITVAQISYADDEEDEATKVDVQDSSFNADPFYDHVSTLLKKDEKARMYVSYDAKNKKHHVYVEISDKSNNNYDKKHIHLVKDSAGNFEQRHVGIKPKDGWWTTYLSLSEAQGAGWFSNGTRTRAEDKGGVKNLNSNAHFIDSNSNHKNFIKEAQEKGVKYGGLLWTDYDKNSLVNEIFSGKVGSSKVIVTENLQGKKNLHLMHNNKDNTDFHSGKFYSDDANATVPGYFNKLFEGDKYTKGKTVDIASLDLKTQVEAKLKNMAKSTDQDVTNAKNIRSELINKIKNVKEKATYEKALNSVNLRTSEDVKGEAINLINNFSTSNMASTKKSIDTISKEIGTNRKIFFNEVLEEQAGIKAETFIDTLNNGSSANIATLKQLLIDASISTSSFDKKMNKAFDDKINNIVSNTPAKDITILKKIGKKLGISTNAFGQKITSKVTALQNSAMSSYISGSVDLATTENAIANIRKIYLKAVGSKKTTKKAFRLSMLDELQKELTNTFNLYNKGSLITSELKGRTNKLYDIAGISEVRVRQSLSSAIETQVEKAGQDMIKTSRLASGSAGRINDLATISGIDKTVFYNNLFNDAKTGIIQNLKDDLNSGKLSLSSNTYRIQIQALYNIFASDTNQRAFLDTELPKPIIPKTSPKTKANRERLSARTRSILEGKKIKPPVVTKKLSTIKPTKTPKTKESRPGEENKMDKQGKKPSITVESNKDPKDEKNLNGEESS